MRKLSRNMFVALLAVAERKPVFKTLRDFGCSMSTDTTRAIRRRKLVTGDGVGGYMLTEKGREVYDAERARGRTGWT